MWVYTDEIVKHTSFILYFERDHTLFWQKSYFICKFTSGNTANDEMNRFRMFNLEVVLGAPDRPCFMHDSRVCQGSDQAFNFFISDWYLVVSCPYAVVFVLKIIEKALNFEPW